MVIQCRFKFLPSQYRLRKITGTLIVLKYLFKWGTRERGWTFPDYSVYKSWRHLAEWVSFKKGKFADWDKKNSRHRDYVIWKFDVSVPSGLFWKFWTTVIVVFSKSIFYTKQLSDLNKNSLNQSSLSKSIKFIENGAGAATRYEQQMTT